MSQGNTRVDIMFKGGGSIHRGVHFSLSRRKSVGNERMGMRECGVRECGREGEGVRGAQRGPFFFEQKKVGGVS